MSKEHSPAPWYWGDAWDDPTADPKYADYQLYDADNDPIIEIRNDHHEPMWDVDEQYSTPTKADRDLIAAAPTMRATIDEALSYIKLTHATKNPDLIIMNVKRILEKA